MLVLLCSPRRGTGSGNSWLNILFLFPSPLSHTVGVILWSVQSDLFWGGGVWVQLLQLRSPVWRLSLPFPNPAVPQLRGMLEHSWLHWEWEQSHPAAMCVTVEGYEVGDFPDTTVGHEGSEMPPWMLDRCLHMGWC